MINPLIAALGLELELSAEEIADVIWLATQMQQSVPIPPRPVQVAPQPYLEISLLFRPNPILSKSHRSRKQMFRRGNAIPQWGARRN